MVSVFGCNNFAGLPFTCHFALLYKLKLSSHHSVHCFHVYISKQLNRSRNYGRKDSYAEFIGCCGTYNFWKLPIFWFQTPHVFRPRCHFETFILLMKEGPSMRLVLFRGFLRLKSSKPLFICVYTVCAVDGSLSDTCKTPLAEIFPMVETTWGSRWEGWRKTTQQQPSALYLATKQSFIL